MRIYINAAATASLLLAAMAIPIEASSLRRRAQQPTTPAMQIRDFKELTCNANIAQAQCKSFSAKFGTSTTKTDRVIIPCGECYTMDHPTTSVHFRRGLDIQGKLVFPDNYKLRVATPFVVVQGELEMTALKPIDGKTQVYFFMTGDNAYQTFTPIDNNANACDGEATCVIGKKAFVVAGGRVNLRGISDDTPTWTRLYDVADDDKTIVLDDSVEGKWLAGAEILITSHTNKWNEQQVRTITRVEPANGGYVKLQLNRDIIRPTTVRDSNDFAVEVALLSRNIQFRGMASPSNPLHGGHFQVFHTPTVAQLVQGVEFLRFGQQGKLGYYPIHFHFCGDSPNSMIAKNTIRESFQRCVVVHGTNKLQIHENIAFDTKGHCFITEDGIETENAFIRNLGALTDVPQNIIEDNGFNGDESDMEPATFWTTNPNNIYIGNVAAGSISSGFWFELYLRGEKADAFRSYISPMHDKLGVFDGNVAHSNMAKTGAIRMYDPGYLPDEKAHFTNMKAYRNTVGIFIHKNYNFVVENSLFADNGVGMEIDRAEGIEVFNTKVIGLSDSYKALMDTQQVQPICHRRKATGIDLHTWTIFKGYGGTKFDNVEISGFTGASTCIERTINMDDHNIEQGQFEHFTKFTNFRLLDDGISKVNFCELVADTVEDKIDTAYLTDSDGSLWPGSTTTSTLMSMGEDIEKFVDKRKCTAMESNCFSYCQDTCFRSIRYEIEGANTKNFILEVCSSDDESTCAVFKDSRRVNNHPNAKEGPRTFIAHVPVGRTYKANFRTNTGVIYNPESLKVFEEESHCPSEMGAFGITIQA